MMNLTIDHYELPAADKLELEDKWVLSKLNTPGQGGHRKSGQPIEIGVASAKVYDFIWDTYCDWYIELTKTRLNGADEERQAHGAERAVLCAGDRF